LPGAKARVRSLPVPKRVVRSLPRPKGVAADVVSFDVLKPGGGTVTIEIEEPKAEAVEDSPEIDLSGPGLHKAGCNCEMCVGNHLMFSHGQAYEYLAEIGYGKWAVLHRRLHEGADGVKGEGKRITSNRGCWCVPRGRRVVRGGWRCN